MAGILITGKENGRDYFIPARARYAIFAVAGKGEIEHCVRKGIASKSIAADLDPGKYRIKVSKFTADGYGNASWGYDFYVDMDEQTWHRIRAMSPKWCEGTNTSEGPRLRCTMPGCSEVNMSKWGAVLHEMKDHFGIDPLQATPEEIDTAANSNIPMSASPQLRRGPGRPRKDEAQPAQG